MILSRAAVAALLSLVVAPAYAGLIPGGGPAASDCYVEFEVRNVDGPSNTVTCQDGDPCDADAACDGTCTFQMRLCVNQCANNASVTLKKPKLKGARASLAFDSIKVSSAATCAPFTPVAVKTKKKGKAAGKVTVSVTAVSTSKPKRDTDKLTLVCTPRVGACPPPTTTSTTTVPTTTSTSTTLSCPGLGQRIISLSTDSHVFSSAVTNPPSIDVSFSGSTVLCAGSQDASGVAPLSVATDSYAGIEVIQSSGFFCAKLDAAGSSGKLDCDGGTPVDVSYSLNSHGTGPDDAPMTLVEQGAAGAAGSAYATVNIRTVLCPLAPAIGAPTTPACIGPVATTSDCSDPTKVDFSLVPPVAVTATTGTVNATITDPFRPAPGIFPAPTISRTGAPFDCANWQTEDGPGAFVIPFLVTDFKFGVLNIGDVANVVVLDD